MLLFVSGRCDIPAFYSEWLFQRFEAGFVDVRNPFNPHQISRIALTQDQIDAMIFCTKNPLPILHRLSEIPFPYLFHVTFTPYHQDIESHVLDKKAILEGIVELSKQIGKDRVYVRYDPILLNERYTISYHAQAFEKLCAKLQGKINKIIISFLDMYKNTQKHAPSLHLQELSHAQMLAIGKCLGEIGASYGMQIQTCAEAIDLSSYHIQKGLCVDRKEIEALVGYPLALKEKGVRTQCACLATVDIGDYNCCNHGCAYCYANYDEDSISQRMMQHDPKSSVLLGHITKEDVVTMRKEAPRQLRLL
ncbi:MAG: DUF1848 domain-containing protein [Longicatena caecimuris]|uniref:DUF1848 domain-containing protein n=1 Tax=Longicatena caecimuris TaxID=1796635 RepID=UPI00399BA450